jgi:hypothetical protein
LENIIIHHPSGASFNTKGSLIYLGNIIIHYFLENIIIHYFLENIIIHHPTGASFNTKGSLIYLVSVLNNMYIPDNIRDASRKLRKNLTKAEKIFWENVRYDKI